ncbi:MAG: DNA polymerase III subunit alpha [Blastocatellia bacterium]|nr:DNA polymerase III subunit alpha [Blastocatellia bacterium]
MSTKRDFCHLHLHTDFSLLDGAIQHGPLAKRVAELGMSSVAVTDHGNLFGAISFYNTMKSSSIKPIIGMEAYIARNLRHSKTPNDAPGVGQDGEKGTNHIVLLATNFIGYQNLVKLSSFAYTEGYYYKPRIDRELLAKYSEGLIGLSACLSGVPQSLLMQGKFDEAAKASLEFQDIMGKGNYFLEIQNHQIEPQQRIHQSLVELSRKVDIPLVVTNDCHFLTAEDFEAHDALICLQTGRTMNEEGRMRYTPYHYLRSPEEMWEVFGDELPNALMRTLEIAERCNLEMPKGKNYLPIYPVPENYTIDSYFEKVVREGFEERCRLLRKLASEGKLRYDLQRYYERLDLEIETIKKMGFPGYFLIVWDFIRFAKQQGIPVGPGRGSAAGSLVAYSLAITDVDPMEYELMFERFLNPERVSMPDIDIDFCVRGRSSVINYVSDFYGKENVSQIITFGTMASRAAIKDIGRVMEMPYAEVEKIAKMIPPPVRGRNVSIDEAIKQVPELKKAIDTDERVAKLINLAKRLEGCARHASLHAAGVVISPQPLYELVPVYKSPKDELATQYEMTDLEKTGMLKMDFLGLTTLTIIDDCLKMIERDAGDQIDLTLISLTDPPALKLFADGDTDAIFQFESDGMKDLCRRMKPDGLEDLAALNALYRPGPIDSGMVDDYIERRHGRKPVRYDIADLKKVMGNTYGVPVYQEQIMAIFQVLAGYSLGEADLVRRAMGKKKREELDAHKEKFFTQAVNAGHDKVKLEKLWSSLEGFADYAFNRSHSVAYGLLAYHTAYLKAHYPAHFWSAVLSNELDNQDKVARYIEKAKRMGVEILPPDVNVSFDTFTPQGIAIRFGLAAIKGIGQSAVSSIVAARESGGAFKSLYDFTERVEAKAVNKRVLESLIKSGAFDSLRKCEVSEWRARLFAAIDSAIEAGLRAQRDKTSGQESLFGMLETAAVEVVEPELPRVPVWSHAQMLNEEKETLGFYITGHPLENYSSLLADFASTNIDKLKTSGTHGEIVKIGGIISSLNIRMTKKGDRFAICQLEDQYGNVKVVVWPDIYNKINSKLKSDKPVFITGKLEVEDEGLFSIIAEDVEMLEGIKERNARMVKLRIFAPFTADKVDKLQDTIDSYRGDCPVSFEVELPDGIVAYITPSHYVTVKPGPELRAAIESLGVVWIG